MTIENISVFSLTPERFDELSQQSPYATPFHEREFGAIMSDHLNRPHQLIGAQWGARQWITNVYSAPVGDDRGHISMNAIGYGGPLPTEMVLDGGAAEMLRTNAVAKAIAASLHGDRIQSLLYPAEIWGELEAEDATCKVKLMADEKTVFREIISGNARTAIRKAEKSGVTVRELSTNIEEDTTKALGLLHTTQKQVGSSYLTDRSLFESLSHLQGGRVAGRTLIAEKDAAIIGMATYVYNSKELFHLFHGWDRNFSSACPNQALIWRMMQVAIGQGIPTFNMGQSHSDALLQAKLRWGGRLEKTPRITVALNDVEPT